MWLCGELGVSLDYRVRICSNQTGRKKEKEMNEEKRKWEVKWEKTKGTLTARTSRGA